MSALVTSSDSEALDYSYNEQDPASTTPPIGPPEQSMSSDPEQPHSRSRSNNPLLNDNPLVSELEQEVLDEYSRLLRNVNKVRRVDYSPASCGRRATVRRVFSTRANQLYCYLS